MQSVWTDVKEVTQNAFLGTPQCALAVSSDYKQHRKSTLQTEVVRRKFPPKIAGNEISPLQLARLLLDFARRCDDCTYDSIGKKWTKPYVASHGSESS